MKREWKKSDIRWFNGCVCTTLYLGKEYGIFNEKYSYQGMKWSFRTRPVDSFGKATEGWNVGITYRTKKEVLQYLEKIMV